jgi:Rieske 2Fe-2S family protein
MDLNLRPTAPVHGLVSTPPGSFYLDEAVFVAEQRGIFARSWICVARVDAVAEPGRFVRVSVAGQDLIVVRGREGELRAFKNLCRHRGAALCVERTGQFGRSIRCSYHAWTYGLDGSLVAAPNMREMPDLVKDEHGLLTVRVAQWLGYVFVNLDPAADSLSEQVRPQLEDRLGDTATFDRYRIEDLVVGDSRTYDVASNWKSIIENFMECYHCATLHPELTAALPQFRSGYGTVSGGVGSGAHFAEGRDAFSLSGAGVRPRLPDLLESDDRLFYGVVLRPNVFVILVPDHVAVFRIEPQAAGHTRVVVDWLFDAAQAAQDDFDPYDAVGLLDLTNRQDFAACERCHIGMRSPDFRGVLVPAERVITEFYDWYEATMGRTRRAGIR